MEAGRTWASGIMRLEIEPILHESLTSQLPNKIRTMNSYFTGLL